ncbi:hypothetical protein [Chondrinema litorale]|uniref:hypothetical protein n=1 Tax=Chondrinema litorale TaxID=2994555 RepID=UPI002543F694|nr:hypothetical protein [Chondrinema litorale]UZR96589.1 hypothetical protein OQ292_20795 [Chondrinema litorale]
MNKALVASLILVLSYLTTSAQVKVYSGLDVGFSVVLPKDADIGNVVSSKSYAGTWGLILGVDIKDKWQIESGYINSRNSYNYDYVYYANGGVTYNALGVYSNVFRSDVFPLRFKKKIKKNKVRISPSLGVVFLKVNQSKEYNAYYDDLRSIDEIETYQISTSSQELYVKDFQTYLEGAITLQAPFILEPLNIFVKGSYAYGLTKLAKSRVNYNISDLDIEGEFNAQNRLSYLNFSIGLIYTLKEFKKS